MMTCKIVKYKFDHALNHWRSILVTLEFDKNFEGNLKLQDNNRAKLNGMVLPIR